MDIKVGEYVRSEKGIIARATSSLYEYKDDYKQDFDNDILDDWYCDDVIVKHSFNIIDLIEVGDYVNGFEVSRKDGDVVVVLDFFGQTRGIESKNIKSIVTKEQFDREKYIVGG